MFSFRVNDLILIVEFYYDIARLKGMLFITSLHYSLISHESLSIGVSGFLFRLRSNLELRSGQKKKRKKLNLSAGTRVTCDKTWNWNFYAIFWTRYNPGRFFNNLRMKLIIEYVSAHEYCMRLHFSGVLKGVLLLIRSDQRTKHILQQSEKEGNVRHLSKRRYFRFIESVFYASKEWNFI